MHYDVDYTKLTGAEKRDKALADVKDWLGEERFDLLVQHCKALPKRPTQFVFEGWLSLAGIQGYPVIAFYEHIWPEG